MFRKSILSLVALAVVASIAAFNVETASAAEPTDAARTVFKYLDARDYSPEFDSDGDIIFKHDDNTFVVIFDRDDDEYFRIIYPNAFTLDSEAEWRSTFLPAVKVNYTTKGAKVIVPEKYVPDSKNMFHSVYVTVEAFNSDAYDFARTIPRSVQAIEAAALKFGLFMLAGALED